MTHSEEDLSGVLRRVQKLLAIAQDSRANANEAAAAAAQAEKIMRKYQIDHADLLTKAFNAGTAEMASKTVRAFMKRDVDNGHIPSRTPTWAGWLAVATAKLHDCEVRGTHDPKTYEPVLEFIGFASDVEVAAWTFDYLVGAFVTELRLWQKEAKRSKGESESYRRGFILALCAKLQQARREREAEMRVASASRALVVSKAQAVAAHFGATSYKDTKKAASVRDANAFRVGREAGSKVDVNRQAIASTGAASIPKLR